MVGYIHTAAGSVPVLIIRPSCVTQVWCSLCSVQSKLFISPTGKKKVLVLNPVQIILGVMWFLSSFSMGQLNVSLARKIWRITSAWNHSQSQAALERHCITSNQSLKQVSNNGGLGNRLSDGMSRIHSAELLFLVCQGEGLFKLIMINFNWLLFEVNGNKSWS